MPKYILTKPFSVQISVGGAKGLDKYTKNVGDIVEGNVITKKQTVYCKQAPCPEPQYQVLQVALGGGQYQGKQDYVDIPLSSLKPYSGSEQNSAPATEKGSGTTEQPKESEGMFSGKNILIGLVGIATIYGIYKYMKS